MKTKLTPLLHWLCECFFNRPAKPEYSSEQSEPVNVKVERPLRNIFSNPVVGDEVITSPVIGLLSISRPLAVIRSVVPVIVDAINRVLVTRPIPHISVEYFKGVIPLTANRDATTTVIRKTGVVRVGAALSHCFPDFVSWCSRHIVSAGGSLTSTRVIRKSSKDAALNDSSVSAFADTFPRDISRFSFGRFRNSGQHIELHAGDVDDFIGHNILQKILSRLKGVATGLETSVQPLSLATEELYHE